MNCHICDEVTELFIHDRTEITYYHCIECEYIFKCPEFYQDYDTQKERYDLHTNDENNIGYKAYFQRFLEFVLPLVGRPNAVLDFGCGESTILSTIFKDLGLRCDYYDPVYYPNTLDDNKKYNLIVSTEVFEHLHNPKEMFKSLIERLEEGGYLAIQTQFHTNDRETFKKWYYHQDPTHIVFFTQKSFQVLASLYDCKVIIDNNKNMILIQKRN